MEVGPLEFIVIEFKGNKFKGEIIPALEDVVSADDIRIVDLLFLYKDESGEVTARELDELTPDEFALFNPLADNANALLPPEDVEKIGQWLENNSSAAVLLFEHTWATALANAIWKADGRVVAQERIPHDVVQRALAHRQSAAAPVSA